MELVAITLLWAAFLTHLLDFGPELRIRLACFGRRSSASVGP
jgi:hypothetical protein